MKYLNSDYDIYEDGRCFSHKSNKWLKPQMSQDYPTYNLTFVDGKRKVKIHRMVAETFLPKIEGKNIVNHIDGNTKNFHLSNLEWVNEKENAKHAIENKLKPKSNQKPVYLKNNLENEKWIDCIDFPNYRISNYGRVMNKNTQRLLKICISKTGYPYVNLWKDGKGTTTQIHRFEYKCFYPEENLDGYVINHIDGNKQNNNLSNLEKITSQENNLHAEYIIKTHFCAKKVRQYDLNHNFIAEYSSVSEAFRQTGINNISRGARLHQKEAGYFWEYV